MLENEPTTAQDSSAADTGQPDQAPVKRTRRRAASRPAGTPTKEAAAAEAVADAPAPPAAMTASAPPEPAGAAASAAAESGEDEAAPAPARKRAARKATTATTVAKKATATANRRRVRAAAVAPEPAEAEPEPPVAEDPAAASTAIAAEPEQDALAEGEADDLAGMSVQEMADEAQSLFAKAMAPAEPERAQAAAPVLRPGALIFQAPVAVTPVRRTRSASRPQSAPGAVSGRAAEGAPDQDEDEIIRDLAEEAAEPAETAAPRAGRTAERAGSRRRRSRGGQQAEPAAEPDESGPAQDGSEDPEESEDFAEGSADEGTSRRRRRRRRRQTAEEGALESGDRDDPPNTVVKVRESREPRERGKGSRGESGGYSDDVQGVRGSVRIAAKQQRRRDGRATRSRRAPIITEAEFLARREAVERVMVVRQSANRMQIAVLEDGVLVEHYVNRESSVSYVGNVYLGKVQNVLPSMEAAFVDINKGRNAVLYAGEVNFEAAGLDGHTKRIELALKSGQPVLVQVTKDPIGHKGARLTSQISLPGRFLVYIPGASMMGISRKLPENERVRLKQILKKVVPEDGGVIVRTAAEGASEDELARDVERLIAQWEEIERKAKTASAPALLHGEPDLTVRVIRDIFNEDFAKLIVSGDEAYKEIHEYLGGVAPELAGRIEHWTAAGDVFSAHRVDEQLAKGLDRKVWLPSGGSLVIDRTEAMVVIDVNTGKFTGQGSSSLEETVTRNNLEAAEEIVRQLRLRDLGGIIVIDFIDMVLEANRDLVLRRLVECLGRDRTKHQVAEVTSLGLVQMTRKRVGQGLLEAFSETCEHCNGRGVLVHVDPVEPNGHRPASVSPVPLQEETAPKTGRAARKRQALADQVSEQYGRVSIEPEPAAAAAAPAVAATAPVADAEAEESAPESRASRRRRARKGKADGGEAQAAEERRETVDEDPAESETLIEISPEIPAEPVAPLNLRAHSEDPDSVAAEAAIATAVAEPTRPRRRRAASRPAGSPGAVGAENS
jgi:ribonuclease E